MKTLAQFVQKRRDSLGLSPKGLAMKSNLPLETIEDIESGIRMTLPTSSSKFKKQWNDYHEQKIALWQEICQKHGIIPVILKTVDDPLYVLNNVFSKKIKG